MATKPETFAKPRHLTFKRLHPDATLPEHATDGAGCFDLRAVGLSEPVGLLSGRPRVFGTGLAVEVPKGHVMLVFSRSGHGFNSDTRLANSVGVIDSDYRGEVMVKLTRDPASSQPPVVENGDRIAQAMVIKVERFTPAFAETLSTTERGEDGLGSTGDK